MINKRGSILITAYIVLISLLIFGGIFFSRSVSDRKLFDITRERQEAFYLAESAVDRGLTELRASSGYSGTAGVPVAFGRGEYEIKVSDVAGSKKQILSCGYVPDKTNKRAQRTIEVVAKAGQPTDFFGNAIYSAGDVTLNGNSFDVNGKVIYADDLDTANPENIDDGGDAEYPKNDPAVSPLAQFDFEYFRGIAVSQGNLYDTARLQNVQNGSDSFPVSFWNNEAAGIPNVVYVEGDMVLNGNIGIIGGFFLVVGDVLTDPSTTQDTTINGNGEIDGCIYTTGDFRINGGAGGLNVNGGVWAGNEVRLNGNSTVSYNATFQNAIEGLVDSNPSAWYYLYTWRERTDAANLCD